MKESMARTTRWMQFDNNKNTALIVSGILMINRIA
jgi:hypothetical protein